MTLQSLRNRFFRKVCCLARRDEAQCCELPRFAQESIRSRRSKKCRSPQGWSVENLRLMTLQSLRNRFFRKVCCLARRDEAQCCELPRFAQESIRSRRSKKCRSPQGWSAFLGAPAENRTPDTLIKSQVLYQLSYRGVLSFCSAINLRRICYAGLQLYDRSALISCEALLSALRNIPPRRYANSGHLD